MREIPQRATHPVMVPKPGFNWSKVYWRGPNETRGRQCSYCGNLFPDEDDSDFVPLMLWTKTGHLAEFCDACQRECFGVWSPKANE